MLRDNILKAFYDDSLGLLYAREGDVFHDLDSQLIALRIGGIIEWNDLVQSSLWNQSALPGGVSL